MSLKTILFLTFKFLLYYICILVYMYMFQSGLYIIEVLAFVIYFLRKPAVMLMDLNESCYIKPFREGEFKEGLCDNLRTQVLSHDHSANPFNFPPQSPPPP